MRQSDHGSFGTRKVTIGADNIVTSGKVEFRTRHLRKNGGAQVTKVLTTIPQSDKTPRMGLLGRPYVQVTKLPKGAEFWHFLGLSGCQNSSALAVAFSLPDSARCLRLRQSAASIQRGLRSKTAGRSSG